MDAITSLRAWTFFYFILAAATFAPAAPATAPTLWQAAKSAHVDQIKQLIASQPDQNALYLENGWTPHI
jgi:hypothetical protein